MNDVIHVSVQCDNKELTKQRLGRFYARNWLLHGQLTLFSWFFWFFMMAMAALWMKKAKEEIPHTITKVGFATEKEER